MAGQPTKYSDEMLEKAKEYVDNFAVLGDCVPSIAGLACELGVCENTIQNWAKVEANDAFLRTLGEMKAKQHRVTLNKGLLGEFNAAITKLLLYNHGYTEKTVNEHTGAHGGPIKTITREMTAEEASDLYMRNLGD